MGLKHRELLGYLLVCALYTFPSAVKGGTGETVNLEEALPDTILGYVRIRSISRLAEEYRENPILSLWRDDEVVAFFKPLRDRYGGEEIFDELFEELGVNKEEFIELFPGQCVMSLPDITFGEKEHGDDGEFSSMLYLIDYSGDFDTLKAMMESSARYDSNSEGTEHRLIEDDYLEAPLFLEEVVDGERVFLAGGYALVGKVLVIASPISLLKETVARLRKDGSLASLAEESGYRKVRDWIGEGDVEIFLNLKPIVGKLEAYISKLSATTSLSALGITPNNLVEALSVDVLESIYMSVGFGDDFTAFDSGIFFREKRGLVSLLTYENGDIPQPEFVPPDVLTVSATRFSLREFWKKFEELLIGVSPLVGGIYAVTWDQLNASMGLDFRANLIENLGDEFIVYSGFGQGEAGSGQEGLEDLSQVYVISIKDRQGFELGIDGIKRIFAGEGEIFEEREYLGNTIFVLRSEYRYPAYQTLGIQSLAYALTDSYLFLCLGSTTLLEAALARLSNGKDSIWESEPIRSALGRIPEGGVEIDYYNLGALLRTLFIALVPIEETLGVGRDELVFCNPAALPKEVDFPYFLIGKIYSESDRLYGKSLLLRKE